MHDIENVLDLVRILRNSCNMMMVIPVVIGALGTIPNGSEMGLDELKISRQIETIQTTALLVLTGILRKVPEI